MDLFTGWSDDFGEPQKPKRSKGKIVRRQQQPSSVVTKVPEIRLEEQKSTKEVVETPVGTVAVSAVASEYSIGDVVTVDTVDIDAENMDTGAELKIDTAVVSDNATGEVVAAAAVVEYTEPPEIRSIPSDEIVPIKSSQSYVDWVQKISGEGKNKDKKKEKKKKNKHITEDETDLDRLASVHSEGKMKQSVTISSQQDLDDFIEKQRHKHHQSNGQYGASLSTSSNDPLVDVAVPFVGVQAGGRKIPPSQQKHHSYGQKSSLDVAVPFVGVHAGNQYHSSSDNLLDVSVPFVDVRAGGKKPINVVSRDEDLDAYVEEMMEMRNTAMGKKKNKTSQKEGEYYKKAKKKYEKREKFLSLLNVHEKKALEDLASISDDQKAMKQKYGALVKYIETTKKKVVKAKPDEIDSIYDRYRNDMSRVQSAISSN